MPVRNANFQDLAEIRKLPVQLTNRPVSGILPKHYRVLVLEARTRTLVYQGGGAIRAFMALRLFSREDTGGRLVRIVHLGMKPQALKGRVAAELSAFAERTASELGCTGLLVQAEQLPAPAAAFYLQRGYHYHGGTCSKYSNHEDIFNH